jgi:hypothetical protein
VIVSLARKPQAFRYSRLRDHLLPNEKYKQIWKYVNTYFESKTACKFIVGLLHIAAEKDCEEALANEVLTMIQMGNTLSLNQLQNKYQYRKNSSLPVVHVEQHLLSSYNNLITEEAIYA